MKKGNDINSKMVKVAKKYSIHECTYYYPDVPDEILTKLNKYFDPNMPISIVAYFDTSLRKGRAGVVLTSEGFYMKSFIEKPIFIPFLKIADIVIKKEHNMDFMFVYDFDENIHRLHDVLNLYELKELILDLCDIVYDEKSSIIDEKKVQRIKKGRIRDAKSYYEGKKRGYKEASGLYEIKLNDLAAEFINQKKHVKKAKREFNNLLDDYEEYINNLEQEKELLLNNISEMKETYNLLIELR